LAILQVYMVNLQSAFDVIVAPEIIHQRLLQWLDNSGIIDVDTDLIGVLVVDLQAVDHFVYKFFFLTCDVVQLLTENFHLNHIIFRNEGLELKTPDIGRSHRIEAWKNLLDTVSTSLSRQQVKFVYCILEDLC